MEDAGETISFGALLRRNRLVARLTQEELAARSGLGARTIQNLERGVNQPRPETLGLLATSLQLVGEARVSFIAAAQPIARGPRGQPNRIGGRHRVSVLDVVRFADRRSADAVAHPIPAADSPDTFVAIPRSPVPNNLPVQWTSFIGREQALLDVSRLLESSHLLTLTGAGGCGKSRLAIEFARRLVDNYPDGVWLIELAPLADPALVGQAIASVLGLRETPGRPIAHTLIEHLQPKQTLLVVDNCEHLIEGAAQIVDVILRACPRVRVLATSREALRIAGEVDWRVPSLAVPVANPIATVEDVVDAESVRLFVERGRAVRSDFSVTSQNASAVVQICRRLDGLPLAIELAATQVKVLPIEQIVTGLDQRFRLLTAGSRAALPRHQTLMAMVAWSYDLLTRSAQTLFSRLSVFAGGFTLEAVRAVCGESEDVITPLSELVSKSMVIAEGRGDGVERYHLLETLRQYGQECLGAMGEEESIQRRHAAYYLQFAEDAKPHLFQPEQLIYLARLDREWDNIRAALRWYIDQGKADDGLRLVAALEFFFWYRGLDETEGHGWRTQLLRLPGGNPLSLPRANALLWSGTAINQLGDLVGGYRAFAESLAIARQSGDAQALAWVMHRISRYGGPDHEGLYGASEVALAQQALSLYRAAHDRWGIAVSLSWLGHLAYHRGDSGEAFRLLGESLSLARAVGERHCVAFALRHLGEATIAESDREAGEYLNESLRIYRELTDVQGVACVENFLGRLNVLYGRYAAAREHYRAGLRWFKNGTWLHMMAQSIDGLAMVAAGQGNLVRALRLVAASTHQRELSAQAAFPVEQAELERILAPVRQAVGERGYAAAWAEGQAMTLEEAITYALADVEAATEAT